MLEIILDSEENKTHQKEKLVVDTDVIDESIILHGKTTMTMICLEELGELTQAITKLSRQDIATSEDHVENLIEELADVFISCSIIMHLHDIYYEDIQYMIERKQRRQQERNKNRHGR